MADSQSIVWYGQDALEIFGSRRAPLSAIGARAHAVKHLAVGPLVRLPVSIDWNVFDGLTDLAVQVAEGTTELVDLIQSNKATLRSLRMDDSILNDVQLAAILRDLQPLEFLSFSVFEHFSPELERRLTSLRVERLFVRLRGFVDLEQVWSRFINAIPISTTSVSVSVSATAAAASRLRRRARALGRGQIVLLDERPLDEETWEVHSRRVWLLHGRRCDVSVHDGRRRAATVELSETFEVTRGLQEVVARLSSLRPRRLRLLSEHLSTASAKALLEGVRRLEEITIRPSHIFALQAYAVREPLRLVLIPPFRATPGGPHVTRRETLAIRSWLERAQGRASFHPTSRLVPAPDAACGWTALLADRPEEPSHR